MCSFFCGISNDDIAGNHIKMIFNINNDLDFYFYLIKLTIISIPNFWTPLTNY